MRIILLIARAELKHYFFSPIGYIILTLFSVLTGWFFFHHVNRFNDLVTYYQMTRQPDVLNQINLNRFVVQRLFGEILMMLSIFLPAVTMRLFAEEKKQKTMELLLTAPITTTEIVLGKFVSVFLFLCIMVALTVMYPIILILFGKPGPELLPILTGYAGLVLVGSCILSVGMFASSVTENQIIAFVIALFVTQLFFIISLPAAAVGGPIGELLSALSLKDGYGTLARAFIDTRVLVYYVSFICMWLFLTHRVIEGTRVR